ncbi:hypothetical protein [Nocardioides sp. 1609]|uniref:hypothetical protein n=1 Tax=Nocardioides sp. 1609 TaxID=2508327 RepID=UPI00107069A1|nr:hypothetical protein [Nocardioides sp. 1609]
MTAIRDGQPIPLDADRSKEQAVIDMKALAGLVSGYHNNNLALTPVGTVVLQTWQDEGLVGESDGEEVARCIHLIRHVFLHGVEATAALGCNVDYRGMYARWIRLRQLQPPHYWWQSVEHAQLPSYLDWTDLNGYNPWSELVEKTSGDVGTVAQWQSWAGSVVPEAAGVTDLLARIRGNHRLGGSRDFRQALECIYLAEFDPASLSDTLTRWGVPT